MILMPRRTLTIEEDKNVPDKSKAKVYEMHNILFSDR